MAQDRPNRRFALTPTRSNSPDAVIGIHGSNNLAAQVAQRDFFGAIISDVVPLTSISLFCNNTTLNGQTRGGTALFDLLTTPGISADTAVVNTTVAGTEVQFTKTAGGLPVAFITPRFNAAVIITGADLAGWFAESSALVNAGARVRLYRWRAGVETEFTGSPADSGVEFTTTAALYKWLTSLTALSFLTDDRLLLVPYVTNVGVMTAGTATFNFNGALGVGGSPTYALVQTASGFGDALTVPVNKATVTLLSAPIVGNVMFAQYFSRTVTQTPPAGWTLAINQNNATEQDNQCIYYRIVQSGDGTTYVFGDGTDIEIVTITEWSSSTGWPSNPVDVTASVGRTTAVSTLSSGTTAASTQAATVSIAAIGLRSVQANTPIWTNGFTAQTIAFNTSGPSSLIPAYKIESVAGAKESTASWSGGAETAMGVIAVFKGNSGSGADSYLNIYPTLSFKAESGAAAQNLIVSLLTNTQSFFPAAVTVGAVTLTPPLISSSNSFPVSSVAAGAVSIIAPLVTNSNTLQPPLITLQPISLLPPLLGSTSTAYAPIVSAGTMQVNAPLLTNTNVLYTGVVATSQPIFPPLLSNSNALFAPVVTLTVSLQPLLLTNAQSFPAATVAAGAINVVAPLISNNNTVFAPIVSLTTNLAVPLLNNSNLNVVYSPTTSLAAYVATPPLLVNSIVFHAATVTGIYRVTPPLLSNTQTLFGANITTGAATIVPQIVANQQTFFVATVTGGVINDNDSGMYSVIERRRRQHSRQYRR